MAPSEIQSYRARYLWLEPGRVFAPGELRVSDGRVVGVGPARGPGIPSRAIFPSLVNAHVHLQIPAFSNPELAFVPWVKRLMAARRTCTPEDHQTIAQSNLDQLLDDGVGACGEVDSTGFSRSVLAQRSVGGVCYQELTGFDLFGGAAAARVRERRVPGTRSCRSGLSPHASYSVSPDLFRAAADTGLPLAVHVAETEEEERFVRTGEGPFRDLLQELGRLPTAYRHPGMSSVAWLDSLGLLNPRTTLIHAQHMSVADAELVAASKAAVVVCPGTIEYFGRPPPPVPQWLAMGIPVALGTDSLASNIAPLSLRRELAVARSLWPELAPESVLAMATSYGGNALGRPGLGRLRRGGRASFFSVPLDDGSSDCLEAMTRGELAPDRVWLRGSVWRAVVS